MDWNFDQKLARGSFKQGFTKETKEQEIAVPLIKELPVRLTRDDKPQIVPSLFVVVPQPDGVYSVYLSDPAKNYVARAITSGSKFLIGYLVIVQIVFWGWAVWTVEVYPVSWLSKTRTSGSSHSLAVRGGREPERAK